MHGAKNNAKVQVFKHVQRKLCKKMIIQSIWIKEISHPTDLGILSKLLEITLTFYNSLGVEISCKAAFLRKVSSKSRLFLSKQYRQRMDVQ